MKSFRKKLKKAGKKSWRKEIKKYNQNFPAVEKIKSEYGINYSKAQVLYKKYLSINIKYWCLKTE